MNSHFFFESMNWRMLCRQAAIEQDADRISQIVRRINAVMSGHQKELRRLAKQTPRYLPRVSSALHRAA